MNDSISSAVSEVSQDAGAAPSQAPVSAGGLLRQGRLASGLHIAALAVSLKVPVRRLEALEADRFDLLPDAVFVRALASAVCRALKMDAAPVLALLPASAPPRLSPASARTNDSYDSFSPGHAGRGLPFWRSLSRPVAGSAAALVVAALGLAAWPLIQTHWQAGEPSRAAEVAPGSTQDKPAPDGLASSPVANVTGPVTEVAASPAALPVNTPAAPAGPQPAPAVVLTAAQTIALPSAPPATGIVVFRPTASSWVEVTDANGAVVLRRMLAGGEVAGASGALPLSAVVGRADVTQVQVRGQAFDLSSIARENVARFEVK